MELDLDDCMPLAGYHGRGHIEGYTAERDRPIAIRTAESGGITALGTTVDNDDLKAFDAFPLWQAYLIWRSGRERMIRQSCIGIIQSFCPGYPGDEA